MDLQQRSAEYIELFSYDDIRTQVLDKMPVPEIKNSEGGNRRVMPINDGKN